MNLRSPGVPLALGACCAALSMLVDSAHAEGNAQQSSSDHLIRSAKSGPWSAATTWEGDSVPGAGARVQVTEGHTIVYDMESDERIRMIHVAGMLTFAHDKNTRLDVGLIKVQPGKDASEDGFECDAHVQDRAAGALRPTLAVGTPDRPIDANRTALIRLIDCDGVDKNSWPGIVSCGGRMEFHGAPMNRTWVKLGKTAVIGDAVISLAEPVSGWKTRDRILVTATKRMRSGGYDPAALQTEERVIKSIADGSITLDRPLAFEHAANGDYRAEVANLSRNVVVESAQPGTARGHTMYHRGSAGSIAYVEFRHLGKEGVLGRYSLHYHLCGDSMRGSSIVGASIWDSANRWLTIHGTDYLVVRDCIGYRSLGHGFFLEDGTETCNVFDRNLAIQAFAAKPLKDQALPYDKNDGAGFWWANSFNSFTRNVACENETYGYRFEARKTNRFDSNLAVLQADGTRRKVDIRALPFIRFEENECHSDGLYGFNLGEGVDRVGPDHRHPYVVKNMKIWATHYAMRAQSPSVMLESLRIHQCNYGIYHPNYDRHVYRDLLISETPFEPFSSGHADNSRQHGILTVDGLVLRNFRSPGKSMPIKLTQYGEGGGAASHFRRITLDGWSGSNGLVNLVGGKWLLPDSPVGVPTFLHDYFGPNKHAKVVSARAKDLLGDGNAYREMPPLTGEESRVAEVHDVEFPQLLDPTDDCPPATVITHVSAAGDGKWLVRGTTCDNGTIKRVVVNGREAKAVSGNFSEWELTLEGGATVPELSAHAEDAAGNVERRPHILSKL